MLLAMVGLCSIAYGQNNEEGQTLLRTEKMAAKLELNEAQKAALDKQLKAAKADQEARKAKMKAFREEMQREAFLARQAHEKELKSILTDEQWTEYEKLKAEQKEHAGKRRKGMRKRHARQHQGTDGN